MSVCDLVDYCSSPFEFLSFINLIWLMILTLAFARKK